VNSLLVKPFQRAITDVIALVAPQVDAGACIPEHGETCGCNTYFIGCDPYYCYYSHYRVVFNCTGTCVQINSPC